MAFIKPKQPEKTLLERITDLRAECDARLQEEAQAIKNRDAPSVPIPVITGSARSIPGRVDPRDRSPGKGEVMHGSILQYLLCDCEQCEERRRKVVELADAEARMMIDDQLRWLEIVPPAGNA